MTKSEIGIMDWHRILAGDAPWLFLLEVFLRSLLIYFSLLLVIRGLGKRMAGQLTIIEMAVMLTLGAIVSAPMQIPDKGVFIGLFILVCTVVFQRGVNWLSFKSERFEGLVEGYVCPIVKNGVLQLREMRRSRVSRQQLFAVLRHAEIKSLGEVDRVYLEACGDFSVYKKQQPVPGLSVLPPDDPGITDVQKKDETVVVCNHCGNTHGMTDQPCAVCKHISWTKAICL